jgi:hypothetical protein
MRTFTLLVGLLVLTLATVPPALGQKRPKEDNATAADYKLLEKYKELEGEITTLESNTKQMTLKVAYPYLESNPAFNAKAASRANANWMRKVNQCNRDLQNALKIKNPARRIARLQELTIRMQVLQASAPSGPPPFRPAMAYKDVEAEATDTVIVRRKDLPLEYDDKGNVKQYTDQEKKDLRGTNPKLPGYTAKWEDIQTGQKVKLYLKTKKAIDQAKKKEADKAAKDAAKESASSEKDAASTDKATDKDAAKPASPDAPKASADKENPPASKSPLDEAADKEPRVYATMILIQAEPDPTATPAPKGKKRKNNN